MKILLKGKEIKDLDGRPFDPPVGMAEVVSTSLVKRTDGDSIKLYEMALRLRAGEVDLDSSDLELLESTVKSDQTLTALAKGQILLEIKRQKDLSEIKRDF